MFGQFQYLFLYNEIISYYKIKLATKINLVKILPEIYLAELRHILSKTTYVLHRELYKVKYEDLKLT